MKKLLLLINCISLILSISTCHRRTSNAEEKKEGVVTNADSFDRDIPVTVYDSFGNKIDEVIANTPVIEQADSISKPKRIEHKSDQQSKLDSIKDVKAKRKGGG